MSEAVSRSSNEDKTLAYVAGVMMFVFAPVGAIIAYVDRGKVSPLLASHYNYLIGTFWKALLFSIVNILLSFVLIGFLTMIATGIWYLVRVVRSLVLLSRDESIAKPSTWWI